jgi:hypothetical protein
VVKQQGLDQLVWKNCENVGTDKKVSVPFDLPNCQGL